MQSHPDLAEMITERDEDALKHLTDIRVRDLEDNPVRISVASLLLAGLGTDRRADFAYIGFQTRVLLFRERFLYRQRFDEGLFRRMEAVPFFGVFNVYCRVPLTDVFP